MVLSFILMVFAISQCSADTPKPMPDEYFFCGSGDSRQMAWDTMSTCPGGIEKFNHCCAIHDDCYDQQNGQKACDLDFCECNKKVPKDLLVCDIYGSVACAAVQFGGFMAYKEAATKKYSGQYVIKNDVELAKVYPLLFKSCANQNAVFSSCGWRYDNCIANKKPDCGKEMKQCLTNPKNVRKSDASCDKAVGNAVAVIKS